MADIAAVTRIVLSATDQTGAAFNSVKGGLRGLGDQALSTKNQVVALLGALGVGVFADAILQTIEMNAQLKDMSEKTGLSVETLSLLRGAAKLTDTDLQAAASGAQKLAKTLYDAATGGGESAQAFKDLGVEIFDSSGKLKSQDEVLLAVAGRLADMEDGAMKTALAQKIFGKSGAELIPMLNELAEVGRLNTKISKEQAAYADDLGKTWKRLKAGGDEIKQTIANELTPVLDVLARGFLAAIGQSGGLADKIKQLAADGTLQEWARKAAFAVADLADFVDNLIGRWKHLIEIGPGVGAVFQIIAGGALVATGNVSGGLKLLDEGFEGVKTAAGHVKALMDEPYSTRFRDAVDQAFVALDTGTLITAKNTAAHGGNRQAVSAVTKEYEKLIQKLSADYVAKVAEATSAGDKLTASQKEFLKLQESPLWQQLTATQQQLVRDYYDQIDVQEDVIASQKELEANAKKVDDAYEKYRGTLVKSLDSLDDQIARQQEINATFGLGKTALIDYKLAEVARQIAQAAGIPGEEKEIDVLEQRRLKLLALRDATAITEALEQNKAAMDAYNKEVDRQLKEQQRFWDGLIDSIGKAGADFFSDLLENGSQAFSNLWKRFKTWALQALAEVASKQIVVSIAGAAGIGGSNLANAANGVIPGFGGGGASLFGVGGIGGLFSGSGGIFGAGAIGNSFALSGVGQAFGLSAAGLDAAGGVALTELGTLLGTAIPVIGAIAGVLAIANAAGLFGGKGGPKQGGTAGYGNFYPGETTSEGNSTVGNVLGVIGTQYNAIRDALGGKGSAAFTLGFDTDPQGTAQNRVSSGAQVNGQSVYSIRDVEIGRDSGVLSARLELEAKRSLLAALQASEFPEEVAAIFNSVTAASATTDQIDRIVAYATALGTVNQALTGLGDIDATLDALANPTALEAFRVQGEAFDTLLEHYDGTAGATNELTAASVDYYNSLVQLVAQIRTVQKAVDEMFGSAYDKIYLANRDDKFLNKYYQQQIDSGLGSLAGLSDPAEIQAAAQQISEAYLARFGLLDPKSQGYNAERDNYLAKIQAAQAAVDARLAEIKANATAAATSDLNAFKQLLQDNAKDMKTAAGDMKSASSEFRAGVSAFAAALGTERRVRVDVGVQDQRTVVRQVYSS